MEEIITQYLIAYQLPAVFVGAVFFGETVLLAATFLAAEGVWSVYTVFVIFVVGTIIADVAWFAFGEQVMHYARRWDAVRTRYEDYMSAFSEKSNRAQFLYLLFFKFLYGTRIITIVYLSVHGMSLWKFVIFDTIATIILTLAVMAAGLMVWNGIVSALPILHSVQFGLVVLVVLAIAFNFLTRWLGKKYFRQ